jgi:hypothetical protein
MPYTSESRSIPRVYYPTIGPSGSASATPFQSYLQTASQYGFRSKGELDAAYAAEHSRKDRNWGDTISLIAAYDRIERALRDPIVRTGGDVVHERTYTEQTMQSATPICKLYTSSVFWQYAQPNMRTNISGMPSLALDTDIRAVGGNMLRESRPTKPHANLGQWFGELGQFGGMFNVPTELPESLAKYSNSTIDELRRFREGGRLVGSGYLGGQFGWLPFVGEVINSLDTIAHSGSLIDEFVRNSAQLIRRKRSRVTYEDVAVYTGTIAGAGSPTAGYTSSTTLLGTTFSNIVQKSVGVSNFRFDFVTTLTRRDKFRTSALYEYFVADPEGFLGTAQGYAQKAKYLLGDPLLSLSTFWELTPWSWAVDWSYNLGGLLSFQESVAQDSLVARRCSTVFERQVDAITHWTPYLSGTGTGNVVDVQAGKNISLTTYRQQRRLPGSPYDMGIDWSGFSSQKWFILGALGLAKAPGVKP